MIVIDFENRYLHGYLMDLDDFWFFGKPLIWIFTIFWIRTRTVPRKFFKMSLTPAKIENIVKIENIFLDRSIFFLKKKLFFENFFYFLKVNRLNFNQLVVRNSRAQYHHFDTWKTEKISPKLQFGIRDSRLKSFLRNFRGTVLIQIQ